MLRMLKSVFHEKQYKSVLFKMVYAGSQALINILKVTNDKKEAKARLTLSLLEITSVIFDSVDPQSSLLHSEFDNITRDWLEDLQRHTLNLFALCPSSIHRRKVLDHVPELYKSRYTNINETTTMNGRQAALILFAADFENGRKYIIDKTILENDVRSAFLSLLGIIAENFGFDDSDLSPLNTFLDIYTQRVFEIATVLANASTIEQVVV